MLYHIATTTKILLIKSCGEFFKKMKTGSEFWAGVDQFGSFEFITSDALKFVPKTVVKHYLAWYEF